MSRLKCLGDSSASSQKQFAVEATAAHVEAHKPNDISVEKAVTYEPRVEEQTQLTVTDEELKMKYLRTAHSSDSAVTGGEPNGEEEQTEEDEDLKAPLGLMIEFLRAVMDRDFQLAGRLCQMILIYEPKNRDASEFLPLIHKKLLEEQEMEQNKEDNEEEEDEDNDEDDDDDDDDTDDSNDSESDEESYLSSSCSSSSSSPSDDDEEEEKQVNRHKLCPPSHVSP
ncbi:hypothetical protein PAMA_005387 [Pampus argenteus]